MRREIWIAAALGLSLTGAAHAQQTQQQQGTGSEAGTPTKPDTDTQAQEAQAHEEQAKTAEMEEQKEQQSERLSVLEADGIELNALDGEQVMVVQTALQAADYYEGEIDGIAGKLTRQALSQFYRDHAQLASRGMISPQAALTVGIEEAEIERVSGEDVEEEVEVEEEENQQPAPEQPTR